MFYGSSLKFNIILTQILFPYLSASGYGGVHSPIGVGPYGQMVR